MNCKVVKHPVLENVFDALGVLMVAVVWFGLVWMLLAAPEGSSQECEDGQRQEDISR